jgi:hypothetical protein
MADAESAPGTRIPVPSLAGTAVTWGTLWPQLPNITNDPEIKQKFEGEDFQGAFYMHPTDVDVVASGTDSITLQIKEGDIGALALALGTALVDTVAAGTAAAGYTGLKQVMTNAHMPMKQLCLQRQGPQGGWGQILHVANVKRMPDQFIKTARNKINTLDITFKVLASTVDIKSLGGTADAVTIPEGACSYLFEYAAAPTA